MGRLDATATCEDGCTAATQPSWPTMAMRKKATKPRRRQNWQEANEGSLARQEQRKIWTCRGVWSWRVRGLAGDGRLTRCWRARWSDLERATVRRLPRRIKELGVNLMGIFCGDGHWSESLSRRLLGRGLGQVNVSTMPTQRHPSQSKETESLGPADRSNRRSDRK